MSASAAVCFGDVLFIVFRQQHYRHYGHYGAWRQFIVQCVLVSVWGLLKIVKYKKCRILHKS